MQIKARVLDVYGSRVTLDTENIEVFEASRDKDLVLEIKGQGRSLNANNYFHRLSDLLAEKLHTSKPFMKNLLMSKYGQKELDDNGRQLMLSVIEEINLLERSDIHCEIKGQAELQGKNFVHYGLLRPTHLYSSKEMNILISGTVEDAKEQGIETLTPDELARMMNSWKPRKNP